MEAQSTKEESWDDCMKWALTELWQTSILADVTVQTSTKAFKAHKIVLASHSDWFSTYFQTRQDNLVMLDDSSTFDTDAVERVLEYMYNGNYNAVDGSPVQSAIIHARVCITAEEFHMTSLQNIAFQRFRDTVRACYLHADFPVIISTVYGIRRCGMWSIRREVVETCARNFDDLCRNRGFSNVWIDCPGFAADLCRQFIE
ncbi:hypothetical protein ASPZODRAFT_238391 [Penicilliopsis zonata CBS 506.65]|uniref:BTB domain-containing protein n=1 Tax=Penicilliopsis zonata CBS 506.65 TaxID=1073090 RepID=A0A1L9SUG1_9EURO|nr:hypothetical protein ASPZODRAFT_238391 [Penicilliopsis zonata CBS 506.65]OJJ50703.1 hypothetical protein ASPZODRAFT_238391 [Penicilliopsis zonata CBS 506.65]